MTDARLDDRPETVGTVVVGAGQAGLSVGYHLARHGLDFVILDAKERIGDAWRHRWDSLRLFTPAWLDGLDGMPFPAPRHSFPTKDEMADYLEAYAAQFELPVRTGTTVDLVSRDPANPERFLVTSGQRRFEAENVVVAMANYQVPRVPPYAAELSPGIRQMHSSVYRNQSQLAEGHVLVVGAGNSGAEIALESASDHPTWLAGPDTGHIPFHIDTVRARPLIRLILRVGFHRILTLDTPIGRRAKSKVLGHGMPLIRTKPKDLVAVGVERVPKMVGVRDGYPLLEDGRVLDVANVIWCTGFGPDNSWIDLPVFDSDEPRANRGIVASEPGLYFVGLMFLYAASSAMIQGVGRDAERIAGAIAARTKAPSMPVAVD